MVIALCLQFRLHCSSFTLPTHVCHRNCLLKDFLETGCLHSLQNQTDTNTSSKQAVVSVDHSTGVIKTGVLTSPSTLKIA